MLSVPVIMMHILLRHLLELQNRFWLLQVKSLPLVAAEESFGAGVVLGSPAAVHADSDRLIAFDAVDIVDRSKLAALITIDDLRRPVHLYSFLNGTNDKVGLHRIAHRPTDNKTGIPVHDGHQVNEAAGQAAVRNVDPPDLIDSGDLHISEQIRVGTLL